MQELLRCKLQDVQKTKKDSVSLFLKDGTFLRTYEEILDGWNYDFLS
jgi:hypothetical protein